MKNKRSISIVSTLHYIRLAYRSALFVMLLISYIRYKLFSAATVIESVEKIPAILYITWAVFVVEMITRFFPSKYESPGCQKQFARNYIKSGSTDISISDNNSTVLIALIWIVFNGIFGALHMVGILDDGIMVLLCSVYSICDIICILVLLSFPDMVYEEQMLQYLQDIQLGLCNDVHASVFCQKKLYVESAGIVGRTAVPLGNNVLPASGAVF